LSHSAMFSFKGLQTGIEIYLLHQIFDKDSRNTHKHKGKAR